MEDLSVIELNLKDLCSHKVLSQEREIKLFQQLTKTRSTKRKKELRDEIIKHNGRLVVSVAIRYYYDTCGVPFHDLLQDGVIGLMRAIAKFDYTRGYKFSTYATWWIRQAVTRAIDIHGRNIRLPVHKSDMYSTISFIKYDQPDISADELAEMLGVDNSGLQEILAHGPGTISLDVILNGDDNTGNGYDINSSDSITDYDDTQTKLLTIIEETCTSREAKILKMRYGFVDGVSMTLKEIGEKFGLTRERIRQLEGRALKKLKKKTELRELL